MASPKPVFDCLRPLFAKGAQCVCAGVKEILLLTTATTIAASPDPDNPPPEGTNAIAQIRTPQARPIVAFRLLSPKPVVYRI